MDCNSNDVSLLLYNYLCTVVGSETVVKTRRMLFYARDYSCQSSTLADISGGSKAEGLDFAESDFDNIFVWNHFSVWENMNEIPSYQHSRRLIPLVMDTNDTKPGYTLLKLGDMNTRKVVGQLCYDIGYETFLSSSLLRDITIPDDTFVVHGPSRTSPETSIDFVSSFHSDKWISQAEEWIHRTRSSWPHNRIIEACVQSGVLFVPKGCENSPRKDLEFRISFNVAEKLLVHSFSHVQLLCYALLKIILNHFIKPNYEDLLCSYFLKTIMFWVLEESEESIWRPQNLVRCFDQCFKRLVYCVTYCTCLHYFIPELDLFSDRFTKSEHDSLTYTLQGLYKSRWRCVLQSNLLSSFYVFIQQSPTRIVPSVSALPSVIYSNLDFIDDDGFSKPLIRSVFGSQHLTGKQLHVIMLSRGNQWNAQRILLNETSHKTNKQIYRHYRKCAHHLLQGLHHDAVSGWLLLASFFYTRKQYQQCLYVLNYCLHKCTPDKILLHKTIDTELQHEFNIEMRQHIKNSFLRACKRRTIDDVKFEKQSFIIPAELSTLVVDGPKYFPSVVFAHFLHCICLHRLNRSREKINALLDLERTVRDMYLINNVQLSIANSYTLIATARKLLAECSEI